MVRLWFHTNWKGVLVSLLLPAVIPWIYRKAFPWNPHQRGLLFTNHKGDFSAISVTERIYAKSTYLFVSVQKSIRYSGNIALDFLVFYVCRSAPCCPAEGGRGAIPYTSRIGIYHPKGNGIVPWFQTKMGRQSLYPFSDQNSAKNNTLWGGKWVYGLYKGVPPRVFSNPKDEITSKIKLLLWTLFPRRMKIILLSYSASLDKFVLLCFMQDNFNIWLFPVTGHARRVINAAIRHWQRNVPCLKFVPRSSHRNYVSFFAGGG